MQKRLMVNGWYFYYMRAHGVGQHRIEGTCDRDGGKLGVRDRGCKMVGTGDTFELRESPAPYKGISGYENEAIRLQNEYYWENSD